MTLATATFQGMPYPVGSTYGRDTQFNPAVPADVPVTASLYPDSSAARVRTTHVLPARPRPAGLFGAAAGHEVVPAGRARRVPRAGCSRPTPTLKATSGSARCATPASSTRSRRPSIARGKKIRSERKYVDRGETKLRGLPRAERRRTTSHHITFPYLAGDVLLIAAEGYGREQGRAGAHVPDAGDTSAVGHEPERRRHARTCASRPRTATRRTCIPSTSPRSEYYYGAAPRPGFMGRFLVGESNVRAPYWSVSPNSFGGQIGASPNGDAPGDIYRLLGGVVLRRPGQDADVRGLHLERVPAAEGHEQQPRGRRRVRGPQRAARREGALLPRRPPAGHRVPGRRHVPARAADRSAPAGRDPVRADVSRRPPAGRRGVGRPVRIVCRIDRVAARRGRRLPLPDRRDVERLHGAHAGPAGQRRRVLRLLDDAGPPAPRACASTAPRSARSRPRPASTIAGRARASSCTTR